MDTGGEEGGSLLPLQEPGDAVDRRSSSDMVPT